MKCAVFVFTIVITGFSAFCQNDAKVQEAFKNKDWKTATKLLNETTTAQPDNAIAWLQLGSAYLYQSSTKEADRAYAKANEFGIPPLITNFHKARAYGDMGNVDQSLVWLDKAVDSGFVDINRINNEPALEKVRAKEQFQNVKEKMERRLYPCKYNSRNKEFDFWIGEWNVFDHNQGFQVGTSKIEKLVGDCIIYENWTDSQSTGKSINYYDASINKWKQNWVSQNGTIIWYEGELLNGKMEYEGERIPPNGERVKTRVTLALQPDGSVRQTAADFVNGAWVVNFDADYKKLHSTEVK